MDKINLELFKQAISEGLSQKFDSVVSSYTDEIVCSEKHSIAMRTIVYGKTAPKRTWSPGMKRIIAILIAAALLLTGCAVIFRDEICEIFEDFFVKLTYSEDNSSNNPMEEIYHLGYLPEGYHCSARNIKPIRAQYELKNENGGYIWFEQRTLDGSDFSVDSESGYSQMKEIEKYDVYFRCTNKYNFYVCNDGKFAIELISNQALTNKEIESIIDGLK